MAFLKNCWYIAGWSKEIENSSILARRICDIPLAIFRADDGPKALYDACPHRFAPLSRGSVVNNSIICGYHGLGFGGNGACTTNPHGPITKTMCVKSYPAFERHKAIWVWLGDADKADPDLIPPLDFQDTEYDTALSFGYLHGAADYKLYIDNIMDLSHADFLHANTLGGSFVGTKQEVKEEESTITVRWSQKDMKPNALHISIGTFPADARVDRFTEVKFYVPCTMVLVSAFGALDAPESEYLKTLGAHIMVPETESTVHYFFSASRNFRMEDGEFNKIYVAKRDSVFINEDKPMIDAVQERMGGRDLFEMKPLLLKSDDAAVRVRRKVNLFLKRESEA